ncbi:MAG: hypothetical protein AB7S68_42170 [Polyangiaceae bacterium]
MNKRLRRSIRQDVALQVPLARLAGRVLSLSGGSSKLQIRIAWGEGRGVVRWDRQLQGVDSIDVPVEEFARVVQQDGFIDLDATCRGFLSTIHFGVSGAATLFVEGEYRFREGLLQEFPRGFMFEGPDLQEHLVAKDPSDTQLALRRRFRAAVVRQDFYIAEALFLKIRRGLFGHTSSVGKSNYAKRRLKVDWRPDFDDLWTTYLGDYGIKGPRAVEDRGERVVLLYNRWAVISPEVTEEQLPFFREIDVIPQGYES